MLKKLMVGKLEISYDIEKMIEDVSNWKYDKDSYDGKGEVDTCASYAVSKSEFKTAKENFIKSLVELKDETRLTKLLTEQISTNKNGSITKNRRNSLLNFEAVRDYNNSYGSHSYTVDALMVRRDSDFVGTLVLSYYKEQSSF